MGGSWMARLIGSLFLFSALFGITVEIIETDITDLACSNVQDYPGITSPTLDGPLFSLEQQALSAVQPSPENQQVTPSSPPAGSESLVSTSEAL